MTRGRDVLFVQGAGAGTYDEWDIRLADSLRACLGPGFDVRYPRMPAEDDPHHAPWAQEIRRHLAELDDGAVVVGHSVGGAILVQALAEEPAPQALAAIVLLAAPFVGEGGWPGEEFELTGDLGARLPAGVPVLVFHGLADDVVPAAHAELYAAAVPQARVHLLPGRDHQLGDDLAVVAREIAGCAPASGAGAAG